MNPYQHPIDNTGTSRSIGNEAQFGDHGGFPSSRIEFPTTMSSYEPQQPYIPDPSGTPFSGYTIAQYPANWLPTGATPIERSSVDSQAHMLHMSTKDPMVMANWSNIQPGMSNKESSSEGQASPEGSPPLGEDAEQKKKERKEVRNHHQGLYLPLVYHACLQPVRSIPTLSHKPSTTRGRHHSSLPIIHDQWH